MDHIKRYVDYLEKYLSLDEPVKVVFDCSNGTTGRVLKEIVKRNDLLEAHFINDEEDGTFPAHNPGPLVEGAMDDLMEATPKENADVGVIFDPDGDRVFFVDEKGERLDPREMFAIVSSHFDPPYVVNASLGKKVLEWIVPNTEIMETKTGHYFIKKFMRENDISFGIEHSGHYYFKDFYFADSGIIPALIVFSEISKLKKKGKTVSTWRESIPEYHQSGELNFEVENKEKIIEKIKEHFGKQGVTLKEIDGITIEGDAFWANIRASNTESLLRINVAAKTKEVFEEKKEEILNLLQE